jgi:hypothetical protein
MMAAIFTSAALVSLYIAYKEREEGRNFWRTWILSFMGLVAVMFMLINMLKQI